MESFNGLDIKLHFYSTRENWHMDVTVEKKKKLIKFRVTLFPKKEWIWVGI